MSSKKDKLNTQIEKTVHRHMDRVTEGAIDFTFLFIRRNNVDIDRDSLNTAVNIFREAMASEHLGKLDIFMKELDKSINSFIEDGD